MNPVRILLADDHQMVREGFRMLLGGQRGWLVVGETGQGLEVLKLCESLKPDILVLDLMMPGLNGLEITRQLCRKKPHPSVIIVSMHAEEAYVAAAWDYGASAYVLKDASSAELVQAVRQVLDNRRYLSPPLTESAIRAYIAQTKSSGTHHLYDQLTTREREVMHLSAEGHTNSQIGAKLFISPRTVETHRAHLMHKLRIKTQADLVRFAVQKGILPLDPER